MVKAKRRGGHLWRAAALLILVGLFVAYSRQGSRVGQPNILSMQEQQTQGQQAGLGANVTSLQVGKTFQGLDQRLATVETLAGVPNLPGTKATVQTLEEEEDEKDDEVAAGQEGGSADKDLDEAEDEEESACNAQLEKAFTDLYEKSTAEAAGQGGASGAAIEATRHTQAILKQVIRKYNVTSLIDIPCGRMLWMPKLLQEIEKEQPGFRYYGLDIVEPMIANHILKFVIHRNWRFEVLDMTRHRLPGGYDLVLTREALQYLNCSLVVDTLRTLAASDIKYLLVGGHGTKQNRDIGMPTGLNHFRTNLRAPPYSLSQPLAVYDEHQDGKLLLLYNIAYLRKQDFKAMKEGCKSIPACTSKDKDCHL